MKKTLLILAILFVPGVAFGQRAPTLGSLLKSGLNILNLLIPFIIGIGLVIFLYGVVRYVLAGGSEDKAAARQIMLYGIIALFVMVSVWGLVNLIRDGLGISNNPNIVAPTAPNSDFPTSDGGESGIRFR